MPLVLVIPSQYPLIVMGLAANFFFLNIIPPLFMMPVKKRVYSKEHMARYEKDHQAIYGPES